MRLDDFKAPRGGWRALFNIDPGQQSIKEAWRNLGSHAMFFSAYYDAEISHHVEELEQRRLITIESIRNRARYFGMALVGLICFAVFWYQFNPQTLDLAAGTLQVSAVFILYMLCFVASVFSPGRDFHSDIKRKIYPKIIKYFGDDFDYQPRSPLRASSLVDTRLFPSFDEETMTDYVTGVWDGVRFEVVSCDLVRVTGHKNEKERRTVFQGLLLLFPMNKTFAGHTLVDYDRGAVGNLLKGSFQDLENVRLEDPMFEQQFEVYSTDQTEARYLLTPSFMERLLSLSRTLDGRVKCSFKDQRLVMSIKTKKDYFQEPSLAGPISLEPEIRSIFAEMSEFFGVIDDLQLGQTTRQ